MGKNKWKQKSLAMLLAFTMGLGILSVPGMSYAEVAVADTYLDKEIIKEQAEPSDITKDTDLEDKLEPDITTPAVIELEPLIALAVEQKSFASGKGIEGNPYKIANEADLRFLSEMVNKGEAGYTDKYYVLTDNINVESGLNWAPIGTQSSPFKGNFDGGGKAIRGLSIDATEYYNVGLFGYIQNGYVSNVEINSKITKIDKVNSNVGILAGVIKDSEIKSVTVKGSIIDDLVEDTTNIGGLVGMTDKSQIKASSSDVEIKLSIKKNLSNIGGLVGFNNNKSMIIDNSYSKVVFEIIKNGAPSKTNNIGGFVGKNEGSLEDCKSDVDGKSQSTGNLSGFVGSNEGYIANCSSRGNLVRDSEALKQIRKSGNQQAAIKAGASAILEERIRTNLLGFVSNNTENGKIIGCSSAVNIQSSAGCGISGFISRNEGSIKGCSSEGELESKVESQLAGFILSNHGEITNCSSGNILSGQEESKIAGFCIYNIKKIANCYSTSSERAYLDSKDKQLSNLNTSKDAYRFVVNNYGTIVNTYATGMIGQNVAFVAPGFEEGTKNIYASLASFKKITPVASVSLMTESEMRLSSGEENALVDILNNNLISEKEAGGKNEQGDWNGWMVGSENNGFPVLTDTEALYIPITEIKLKKTSVIAGTALCLEGSVEPVHATQKVISWSVVEVGKTGAYIDSGNILRTKESGIVKIKATVKNGSTETVDYAQGFDINVIPGPTLSGKVTMPWGAEFMVNNKATGTMHTTVIALNGEKWYVIGAKDTGLTVSRGEMTLFYENKTKLSDFDKKNATKIYATSNLKSKVESQMNTWSQEEKNAIIKRNLLVEEYVANKLCNGVSKTEVNDASLWPMSPDEAKKINIDLLRSNESTWLRSPGYKDKTILDPAKSGEYAACVDKNGYVNVFGDTVKTDMLIRPAFYLNLSSILLTSDASVSKPLVSDRLKLMGKPDAVQKLTMYSNRLKLEEATTTSQLKSGSAIGVNYSGATPGKTLSAIVENSKGEVTYYGNLVESIASNSGKVNLTLPGDFDSKTMKLKVFIEEVNGENKTNYASTPVEVIGTVAPDKEAPVLTVGKIERTSDKDATVRFTSDEAGEYYYNLGSEVTDTSGKGKPCTTSDNTLNLTNLKTGEQKIYIVAKDAAGNVSEKQLEITIPAYVVIDNKAPVLSSGKVNRTSESDATVSFTSDEEGKYYYNLESAVTDTSGEGKPCTKSNNTLKLENLKPGEQKIYIVAKDAAGNGSDKEFKITIPAYVAPDDKAPVLTVGKIQRTSDKDATVSFTSDEAGQYYYNLGSEVTDISGEGKPCIVSENTITLKNLDNGEQKIYIVAKDAAGNGSDKEFKITIPAYVAPDDKAPVLTVGKIQRTSDKDATVSFTSDEAGQYYYNLGSEVTDISGEGKPCIVSENTITLKNLDNGEQKIYIVAKDVAGNGSDKEFKITIPAYVAPDDKAPVLTVGKIQRTSDKDATVSFTSDEAGQYYYNLGSEVTDISGEGKPCIVSENTITLKNLDNGEQKIYIVAKDAAGNVSDKEFKITIPAYVAPDDKAPVLTVGKIQRTSDKDATVSFTSDEAGQYYYNLGSEVTDISGEGKPCIVSENTITLKNLDNGEQKIYIVAKDAAGNVSDKEFKITIPAYVAPDDKAPVLTVGKIQRTSDKDATVSFTSDEAGQYYYNLGSEVTDISGEGKPCTVSENTITLKNLDNGEQKIYIVAKDAAGNGSDKEFKITIPAYVAPDDKAPVLTVGKIQRTSDKDATVSFTSDEAGQYYYNLGSEVTDISGEGKPCIVSENTITLKNLDNGEQKIYIVAKDAAGNGSDKEFKITIPAYVAPDDKAPVLTVGKIQRTSDKDATVSFTSDEAGQYYYNLGSEVTDISGEGKPCIVSENTITLKNLDNGEQKIYIVAKDAAGNVSEKQLEITIPAYVVIDNKAPVLSNGKVERTSKSDATVSFTSDEEGKYYYNLESAVTDTSGEGKPCTTSNNTLKLENLKPGEQKIYIVAKDAAGNVSEKQLEITIPAYVAPVTPGGGSSSGSDNVKSAQKTVAILVNSKAQNIGQETIKEENGKKIIELSITPEFVIAHVSKDFKFRDDKNIVEIKVTDTDAETARVVLTGNMVKKLEDNDAVLSIQKDNIKYNIPAKEMTVESVAKKLNVDSSKLKEMQIEIELSKISGELAQKYREIAKVGNNEVIIPPVEFNIIGRVTSEDGSKQTVNINRFSSFVERTVELPQGNESKGAMTGIVFNSDGTYSPVPTKLVTENGRSYVKMNSRTNSTYSVIYNPITVDSVKLHWSESSVNDMASRLVLVDTKSFEPNKAISRAEFANYIVRALGLYQGDAKSGQSEFTDVKSDNPSLKGITIASQWGIIGGYPDGSFRPQNTITREEAMSMYSRAMDIAQLDKSDESRILNYKDRAKVSSWAYKAVQKTLGSGVFNGRTAQNIEPKGTFTCSEAAVAIRNLLIKAELING